MSSITISENTEQYALKNLRYSIRDQYGSIIVNVREITILTFNKRNNHGIHERCGQTIMSNEAIEQQGPVYGRSGAVIHVCLQ